MTKEKCSYNLAYCNLWWRRMLREGEKEEGAEGGCWQEEGDSKEYDIDEREEGEDCTNVGGG